jgi:oligopeptide/dipeptide ABC transporter ATP-binding protein
MTSRPAEPLLSVRDLTAQFHLRRGVLRAVEGVSFDLAPGETLGIVGESGSGKSVTAQSILRLVSEPGRIVGGTVHFEGRDLLKLSDAELRRIRGGRIAMIFQNPRNCLNPLITIGDQLARVHQVHRGGTRTAARARAVRTLDDVRIADPERVAMSYPHQLSGGMCQRAMIAMALLCEPALIISDEATTGLDATVQRQILQVMEQSRARTGVAQIIISHDMGVIAQSCDRALVMYAGRIVESARVRDLFHNALHPYSRRLIRAVPKATAGERPVAIPGELPDAMRLPPGCRFRPRCSEARDRCAAEDPRLAAVAEGRSVACHLHEAG